VPAADFVECAADLAERAGAHGIVVSRALND